MSESFPDEGDKVEVISRVLMQYDSPKNRWYAVKSRREKVNVSTPKEDFFFLRKQRRGEKWESF